MHPLEKFAYCPVCGSKHFTEKDTKSKHCENCGFEYYLNPSAATAAFIRNDKGELLVVRRKCNPGKGTLDLPGGFADLEETLEECIRREVEEETSLIVDHTEYLFSLPNKYRYSDFDIPTLDAFFACNVSGETNAEAKDDAAELMWLPLDEIHTEQFGLRSVRHALFNYLEKERENLKK